MAITATSPTQIPTTASVVQIDDGTQCSVGSADCTPCAFLPMFFAIIVISAALLFTLNIWPAARQADKAARRMQRPFDLEKK